MRYIVAPAKTLRKEGLLSIEGNEKRLWILTIIASLVPELVGLLGNINSIVLAPRIFNSNPTDVINYMDRASYYNSDLLGYSLIDIGTYAFFSVIIMNLIFCFLKAICYLTNVKAILNTTRKDNEKIGLWYGVQHAKKAFLLMLMQQFFILLWTLLFIIPGIIAQIRYSMAFYILADNPDKSITQCMDESKAMMKGNLGKYFCVSISFIGWYVLAALISTVSVEVLRILMTSIMGHTYFLYSSTYRILELLIIYASYIFWAMLTLYREATFIGMYRKLIGENNFGVISEETISKYEANMEQKGSYDMEELQKMEEAKLSEEKDEQPKEDE